MSNYGNYTSPLFSAYDAGHQSRDAEVALLKAKIQELEKANQALREYIHAHS